MIPLHDDNPAEITPLVTIALIVTCALVFLYEVSLPDQAGRTHRLKDYAGRPPILYWDNVKVDGHAADALRAVPEL